MRADQSTSFLFYCGTSKNAEQVRAWLEGRNVPGPVLEAVSSRNPEIVDFDSSGKATGWSCEICDTVFEQGALLEIAVESRKVEFVIEILDHALQALVEAPDRQGFLWTRDFASPGEREHAVVMCKGQKPKQFTARQWLNAQTQGY